MKKKKKRAKAVPAIMTAAAMLYGCASERTLPELYEPTERNKAVVTEMLDEKRGILPVPKRLGEGTLSVEALEVGKADAILIRTERYNILVDTAQSSAAKRVKDYLLSLGIEKIDYLIITHFDKDHVGGAAKLLKSIRADNIIQADYEGDSEVYKKFKERALEQGVEPVRLRESMSFEADGAHFTLYPTKMKVPKDDDNNYSIVMTIEHGNNRFLFTGDAEEERITEILGYNLGEFDYIKMPHHGAYENSLPALLKSVKAKYAVICDSNKESAEKKTLSALAKTGTRVFETKHGSVCALSDGTSIKVEYNTGVLGR